MSYCNYSFMDLCQAAYPEISKSEKHYKYIKSLFGNQDKLNKEVIKLVNKAGWYSKSIVSNGVVFYAFAPTNI